MTIRKNINYAEREKPNDENEYRCKILLNQIYILKAKRMTAVENDEIKGNI